jgi:microcystin-dependent protein
LEHTAFKGQSREITCDTEKKTVVVHDGQTLGGFPLAREDLANVHKDAITDKGIASTDADNLTEEGLELLRSRIVGDLTGSVFAAPLSEMPGYLLCDGAEVSREAYEKLFARIGTTFGEGDGDATFNIPDYRGMFLRGMGGNADADFASMQNDAVPNITGTFNVSKQSYAPYGAISAESGVFFNENDNVGSSSGIKDTSNNSVKRTKFDASRSHAAYGRAGAGEVRPKNFAVNFFIKY